VQCPKVKKTNKNDLQNTTQKATGYLSQMTNECSLCGSHNLELIASFMTYIAESFLHELHERWH